MSVGATLAPWIYIRGGYGDPQIKKWAHAIFNEYVLFTHTVSYTVPFVESAYIL